MSHRFGLSGLEALHRAKELLGGTEGAIADVVKRKQSSVHGVLAKGKRVPAEWCIPLEKATAEKGEKISRGAFRSDIYPDHPSFHVIPQARGSNKRAPASRLRGSVSQNHARQVAAQ